MAFKTAARIAMTEGMPQCSPVLLEPIVHVDLHVPTEATPRVNQIVSGRRGQLLGFDARDGWPGWDTVEAQHARGGDRQSDHRAAFGNRRRRHLQLPATIIWRS